MALTCTPKSLLALHPCLACLSEKELIAVLVAVIAHASRTYANNIPAIMQNSACFNCAATKKQLLQQLIEKVGYDLLEEGDTAQEIIDEMHCLVCAPESQLLAALMYLLCSEVTITINQ